MNKLVKFFGLICIVIFSTFVNTFSYQNPDINQLAKEGIQLLQENKFDKALDKFQEAILIEPSNIYLAYQIAFIHFRKEEYSKSIEILEPFLTHEEVFEQVFVLLGNSFDFAQRRNTALEIYREGLKVFPNSVELRIEAGITENDFENYRAALSMWNSAVIINSAHPLPYYHLAKYHNDAINILHSLVYAEMFLNLTRNEEQFKEISLLLFNLYSNILKSKAHEGQKVNLLNGRDYNIENKNFNILTYSDDYLAMTRIIEQLINQMDFSGEITIKKISDFRANFLNMWLEYLKDDDFNFKIFEMQKSIANKGHFEAYNYWLLSEGNIEEFEVWVRTNHSNFINFISWLEQNYMKFENDEKFMF